MIAFWMAIVAISLPGVFFEIRSHFGHGDDARCARLEFLIQEASWCIRFPEIVEAASDATTDLMSRIPESMIDLSGPADGATTENCPNLVEDALAVGLSHDQLYRTGGWIAEHGSTVRAMWSDVLEKDFCNDVERRGWLSRLSPPRYSAGSGG